MLSNGYGFHEAQAIILNTAFHLVLQLLFDNPQYEGILQPIEKFNK